MKETKNEWLQRKRAGHAARLKKRSARKPRAGAGCLREERNLHLSYPAGKFTLRRVSGVGVARVGGVGCAGRTGRVGRGAGRYTGHIAIRAPAAGKGYRRASREIAHSTAGRGGADVSESMAGGRAGRRGVGVKGKKDKGWSPLV